MENKPAKIYLITNKENGKQYIGITVTSIKARWNRHVYDSKNANDGNCKQALHDAIRKYGKDCFLLEEVYQSNDHEHIKEMETHFINLYKTHGTQGGYNMTWGGDGWHGMKHSEEAKKKMSESHKGKTLSEEHKKKISESQIGKKMSYTNKEEWKKNLSNSKRNNPTQYYKLEITTPDGSTHTITNLKRYCEDSNDVLNPQPFMKAIKENKPYKGYIGIILEQSNISHGGVTKHSKSTKNKIKESNYRFEYTITHPEGTKTVTKDLKSFCLDHSLSKGNMTEAAKKNEKEKTQKYGSKGYAITRKSL